MALEARGLSGRRVGNKVRVIVQVNEAGYVPNGVTVRSRVSGNMFTGETSIDSLMLLERDPHVLAVEVGKPLRLQAIRD